MLVLTGSLYFTEVRRTEMMGPHGVRAGNAAQS